MIIYTFYGFGLEVQVLTFLFETLFLVELLRKRFFMVWTELKDKSRSN